MLKKISIIVLSSLIFMSCSKHRDNKEETKLIRIGFSASSEMFLQERWDKDIKIFMSTAKELGAEVILAKSPNTIKNQISQIQYLSKQNIDVLVVIPKDRENLSSILKRVIDKGIPVIAYDRLIMGVPLAGYISFDNVEVGRIMARALIKETPRGNYLVVNGSIHDNNSFEVNKGLYKILTPYLVSDQIKISEEIWLDAWSYDEALEKISNILLFNQDIQAISAANDDIAQAAIKVLAERQMVGKISVVGQDADLVSCQSVVEGTQLLTVYKPIAKLAIRAAKISVDIAKGKKVTPDSYITNESTDSIPFFMEQPIGVTKNNMDSTVIKDGFHSKEDVYREL